MRAQCLYIIRGCRKRPIGVSIERLRSDRLSDPGAPAGRCPHHPDDHCRGGGALPAGRRRPRAQARGAGRDHRLRGAARPAPARQRHPRLRGRPHRAPPPPRRLHPQDPRGDRGARVPPRRRARFVPPQGGHPEHRYPRRADLGYAATHSRRDPHPHHGGALDGQGADADPAPRTLRGAAPQAQGGRLRSPTFSRRTSRVKASAIREILKVTERPEILSFAGGLPAPEAFPVAELARAHAEVFAREGAAALQYSTTEGFGPLRAWVAERMRRRGLSASPEQVLITSGSQQGIDLVARILVDPGDAVVVESPSYLAALQVFEAHEASFVTVGSDEHGMRVDQLERALKRARPKLVYLVPTFQNPKGTTLALQRREQLARLAAEHGVAVLEDDPYGELRYSGAELPAVASLDRRAPIIYLSTFSKTLAPGQRHGQARLAEHHPGGPGAGGARAGAGGAALGRRPDDRAAPRSTGGKEG